MVAVAVVIVIVDVNLINVRPLVHNFNFIDCADIFVKSGKGGAGSIHFRREKFVEKGGPDGGNGGKGGDVLVIGNSNISTLFYFRNKRIFVAQDGMSGSKNNRSGANGGDLVIEVPLGTVVKNATSQQIILEVIKNGNPQILMKGGRGGLGNANFKSATNQAPRFAQPGEPSIETDVKLELKLLADVGLVGFPNAGKSTLLSVVSAAKPKIDSYPFTTLVPQLGVVSCENESFVMADIPGIIEGASAGKGLGTQFLRHMERTIVLLFVVSIENGSINEEYNILLNELKQHNPELLDRSRLLAISKIDLASESEIDLSKMSLPSDVDCVFISAVTGTGVLQLKRKIQAKLSNLRLT